MTSGGARRPDLLIASDFQLSGPEGPIGSPLAAAVLDVLRQSDFRAGRFTVGYQSCDVGTPQGQFSDEKCTANGRPTPRARGWSASLEPSIRRVRSTSCRNWRPPREAPFRSCSPRTPPTITFAGWRNVVRVVMRNSAEAAALAALAQRLRAHRLFIVADGAPQQVAGGLAIPAMRRGVRLVGLTTWPQLRDASVLPHRISRARADVVVFVGDSDAAGRGSAPSVGSSGASLPIVTFDALPVADLVRSAGAAAVGTYVIVEPPPVAALGPAARTWAERFAATQPGRTVPLYAPLAAAATGVLLDAIARSDGTRASINSELHRTHATGGILGSFRFTAQGGDIDPAPTTILRVASGTPQSTSLQPDFAGASIFARVMAPAFVEGLGPSWGRPISIHEVHVEHGRLKQAGQACATRQEAPACPVGSTFTSIDAATSQVLCRAGHIQDQNWFPQDDDSQTLRTLICPDGSRLRMYNRMEIFVDTAIRGTANIGRTWEILGGTGRFAGARAKGPSRRYSGSPRGSARSLASCEAICVCRRDVSGSAGGRWRWVPSTAPTVPMRLRGQRRRAGRDVEEQPVTVHLLGGAGERAHG